MTSASQPSPDADDWGDLPPLDERDADLIDLVLREWRDGADTADLADALADPSRTFAEREALFCRIIWDARERRRLARDPHTV